MAQKPSKPSKSVTAPKTSVASTAVSMALIPLDTAQLPDHIVKGDKRGTENLGMSDLVIPRLEIVQGMSPSVKKGDPGFIPGAAAGALNNSVTRELYGEKVWVIPVHYYVQYLVWRDRKKAESWNEANPRNKLPTDGGFFGAFNSMEEAQARAEAEGGESQCIFPVDTPTHFCLLMNKEKGELEEIMMPMPRTKAKISRQWNTIVKLANAARFSRAYEVGTVLQKNDRGDFYNFAIAPIGYAPKAMFQKAEELYNAITSGEKSVKMDEKGLNPDDAGDTGGNGNSKM